MIKLRGTTCLVQYLDRSALDLPEPKTRLIVTPDEPEEPLGFGQIRLAGDKSEFKVDQIVIIPTARPGARVEFRDMLKTGEILYLLRDGDVMGTYTDETS